MFYLICVNIHKYSSQSRNVRWLERNAYDSLELYGMHFSFVAKNCESVDMVH